LGLVRLIINTYKSRHVGQAKTNSCTKTVGKLDKSGHVGEAKPIINP